MDAALQTAKSTTCINLLRRHRTLPFETMVRVTNVNNGKSAVVRINRPRPFVDNRIIDLSLAAAREIESVGPALFPCAWKCYRPALILPRVSSRYRLARFAIAPNAERLRERLNASYTPIFIQQYDSSRWHFLRSARRKISGAGRRPTIRRTTPRP